jgi:hypothetical protein
MIFKCFFLEKSCVVIAYAKKHVYYTVLKYSHKSMDYFDYADFENVLNSKTLNIENTKTLVFVTEDHVNEKLYVSLDIYYKNRLVDSLDMTFCKVDLSKNYTKSILARFLSKL